MGSNNRVVITVVGKDKVGIIAKVTNVLADKEVNVLDISQTILQDFFTMIMIVDITSCKVDFNTLKESLEQKGQEIGMKITVQHEDVFQYMHRI
nr:ACT domain-containing protein [Desulfonispora thiosulfatigenes]